MEVNFAYSLSTQNKNTQYMNYINLNISGYLKPESKNIFGVKQKPRWVHFAAPVQTKRSDASLPLPLRWIVRETDSADIVSENVLQYESAVYRKYTFILGI
jgi:hypothetical protein